MSKRNEFGFPDCPLAEFSVCTQWMGLFLGALFALIYVPKMNNRHLFGMFAVMNGLSHGPIGASEVLHPNIGVWMNIFFGFTWGFGLGGVWTSQCIPMFKHIGDKLYEHIGF